MPWLVVDGYFRNAEYIFPTQQRDVHRLITKAKQNPNIRRIVIFGSSVTAACNPWSDIDAYFELEFEAGLPVFGLENSLDSWTNFSVDNGLLEEIERTGVVVYERDIA